MVDFHFESLYGDAACGVDEAGRGPLAGPVVAAAVVIGVRPELLRGALAGLNDSKQVKRAARERLFAVITERFPYAVGVAGVEEIDAFNILRASLLAMERAVAALPVAATAALVDGTIAPQGFPAHVRHVHCVPQGDGKSASIAAASIVAKVTRDRMMEAIARDYPQYGFERHRGYGTRAHLDALVRHGPTPWHRRSFAPVRALEAT